MLLGGHKSNGNVEIGLDVLLQGAPGMDMALLRKPSSLKIFLNQIIYTIPNVLRYIGNSLRDSVPRGQTHNCIKEDYEEPLSEGLPNFLAGYSKEFHVGNNVVILDGDKEDTYSRNHDQNTSTWSVR